jgi:AbrB family looped-hinge helix DNA binding protein
MSSVAISSKHQIVVPKEVRQELKLHAGQRLYVKKIGRHSFTLSTEAAVDTYYGSLKDIWQDDAVAYQHSVRQPRTDG